MTTRRTVSSFLQTGREDGCSPTPLSSRARVLVFDSGIGGLGVVQALREKAPDLTIDYLADTALFPYGEQPDEILVPRIVSLLKDACRKLSPSLVVIACNTASTLALPALRATLDTPVVGCVPPIRWAARVSRTRTIGLLATSATARRQYVRDLHETYAQDCRMIVHGGRGLADLAERAFTGEPLSVSEVEREVEQLFAQKGGEKIDTIGLGCTHYTFLMPYFNQLDRPDLVWLDPAPAVAQQALRQLERLDAPQAHVDPHDNRSHFMTTKPAADPMALLDQARAFGFSLLSDAWPEIPSPETGSSEIESPENRSSGMAI